MADREVDVVVEIGGEDVVAGRLWSHRRRGAESQTFSYDPDYLARRGAYELDPVLKLVAGPQQTPVGRAIFGAFFDCAPDRWGRRLIERREENRAERGSTARQSLGEIDYLLGVRDDLRQGALRFREPGGKTFLADEEEGIPSLVGLGQLLSAAEHWERDEATEAELATLLRGGSSLGGARPKAHVLDSGKPAIAKFPSPGTDDWNVMRWEGIALELARRAGIDAPRSELHTVDGSTVLIVYRFDRSGGERLGYVSALTMLERTDGDRGSYLEIAEVIEAHSSRAGADLHELWRRIAFSILISNFDDHLRNHGFLRTSTSGWDLSPAFDLNPDPRARERHLTTAISDYDTEARIDVLMGVADYFRLGEDKALGILGETSAATSHWRAVAAQLGATKPEIKQMATAFEHEEAARARNLVGP